MQVPSSSPFLARDQSPLRPTLHPNMEKACRKTNQFSRNWHILTSNVGEAGEGKMGEGVG